MFKKHKNIKGAGIFVSRNGSSIIVNGGCSQSISIIDGKVKINGHTVEDLDQYEGKNINITIEGGCHDISVDVCEEIHVTGNSGGIQTHNGNVKVDGSCDGNIITHNGNVHCGDVRGNVQSHNGNIHHK